MAIDLSGEWEFIFSELGSDRLRNSMARGGKPSACPFQGHENSKDGFKFFKDWTYQGGGICNTCGPAPNGIKVLSKVLGISEGEAFKRSAQLLENAKGNTTPKPYVAPEFFVAPNEVSEEDKVKRRKTNEMMLKYSTPFEGSIAQQYIRARQLDVDPAQDVFFNASVYYKNDEEEDSKHPAMISIFRNPQGEVISLHRTYLSGNGSKAPVLKPKKITAPAGNVNGGAIRLFPLGSSKRLAISEGIETALAAHELCGMPSWACYSASILQGFQPPDQLDELHVFADFDINSAGINAAKKLKETLSVSRPTLTVYIHVPPNNGQESTDWLDWLVKDKST